MSRGNPNQMKLLKEIQDLGYNVKVKHNQIHIDGVKTSPFYPDSDPDEPTYGMTMTEAEEWIRLKKKSEFDPTMRECYDFIIKEYESSDSGVMRIRLSTFNLFLEGFMIKGEKEDDDYE